MKTSGTAAKPRKRQQVIVFKDGAGNYYAVSRATMERSRVSKERAEQIRKALEDEECITTWIKRATIPGSIAAAPFEGGRALHYAGYYLSPLKANR
jgi:hypothetical protein